MSHNDTWMPLYIGDYLGDTMELDGPQHGAYLLLLMYYWRNGPLPLDDVKLAQIARTDIKAWKKVVGPVVRGFFHEEGGRLHQKRCDLELAKAEGISSKRRAAAGARWNGHDQHPPDGSTADANASANAVHVDMQTASTHARASPSQSQSQKEPPRSPPATRGGRAARPHRNGFVELERRLKAAENAATIDGTHSEIVDFLEFTGARPKLVGGTNG